MFHAGETVGPFRLEALCGRGRFAEVWRAVRSDRAVAAPVALKIPFDQDEPEKLLNEARQLLDLSHPHIVQVAEADVYDGTTCAIALEYFPEGSLFDRLQHGERLSIEEAVQWTCDVLAGVQHAHDHNILHCDLKPANVFVRHGVAKVGDFGIARLLGLHSHTQFLGGTVAYAAPERFQKKTGKPSEVWSVGVMLYEMLAGGRPFVGDDETELLAAILQEEPPPLRSLNPDVPAWLEEVVHTALSKEVAARFASAGAMREALQHSALASAGPAPPAWPLPAPAAPVGIAREEAAEFSTEPASSPWPQPAPAPVPRRPQLGGRLRRLLKFWPSVKAEAAPPPQAQRGDTWTNPKDHAKMVFIPAGEFVMGTTPAQVEELLRGFPDWKREGFANEQPAHVVYLDAYWIDKTEVTNAQFARFVRETGYKAEGGWQEEDGKEQHPAVKVSWNDAVAYAQWAGKRLPTEAEWEKAARGEEGRVWPWGNVWEETRCNFRGRADGYGGTAPVGSFPQGASPYGCLNMAGNVWEWCADWYEADYYGNSPERNPAGPPSGEKRVLRGGSWIISYPNFVRCAYRYSFDPRLGHGSYGFRCAKTPR